jgi:hypothetical protein
MQAHIVRVDVLINYKHPEGDGQMRPKHVVAVKLKEYICNCALCWFVSFNSIL